jgi:hypothetical protein
MRNVAKGVRSGEAASHSHVRCTNLIHPPAGANAMGIPIERPTYFHISVVFIPKNDNMYCELGDANG